MRTRTGERAATDLLRVRVRLRVRGRGRVRVRGRVGVRGRVRVRVRVRVRSLGPARLLLLPSSAWPGLGARGEG